MSETSEKSEMIPADLVRTLLSSLDKKSSKKSTIQIRPDVTWPSLSDHDQDIETFFEELDDICDLANDADGMSDIERLRVLGKCLKQSRKQNTELNSRKLEPAVSSKLSQVRCSRRSACA
jgi:hypothetical protein